METRLERKRYLLPWQPCTFTIGWCGGGWIIVYPVLIWLLFTKFFWIPLLMFLWMLVDDSYNRGGRSWRPLQNSSVTDYWYQHFPVTLHITAPHEITPDKNYIFACHPHGIVATGVTCAFITAGLNIKQRLPGMRFTLLVTRVVFAFPLFREVYLWIGCCSASARNMQYIASKGTGNVMLLLPGGMQEMYETRPGSNTLVLEERKGFIRIALQTGCDLVPVYSFGETDTYDQPFDNPVGSRLRTFQKRCASLLGIPALFFYGRSKLLFWQPRNTPVNVVVGKPIKVTKQAEPSQKDIDDLHATYKLRLKDLFDKHKSDYGCSDKELKFI